MATVLLTDPSQRAALAAARALAARGHAVHVIGATRGLAGRSRSVRQWHRCDSGGAADAARFRTTLAGIVRAVGVDVVLPITDSASRALLGFAAEVGAPVAGPSREAYERASDKDRLLALAPSVGLHVPRQHRLEAPPAAQGVSVPWSGDTVVKPARSVVELAGKQLSVGVTFAGDHNALQRAVASYPPAAYPLLLQERIPGEGVGVFLLRTGGRTTLVFGHRRLREKPPAGGVSTYREAIPVPDELRERCEALLDRLEYEGVAMIEFKHDPAAGVYSLMEINARLWGSLQLAIDAGADFPSLLVAAALGEPSPVLPRPRAGVRTVWELGELDHALALARRSRAALHLPAGTPVGAGAALRVLFDHRWSDRGEVFRIGDPLPFFAEFRQWLRRR